MQTITITSNWQIHVPVSIRQKLKLKKGAKVEITSKDNQIILTPIKSEILELSGKYRGKKPIKTLNIDNVRDMIDYSNL